MSQNHCSDSPPILSSPHGEKKCHEMERLRQDKSAGNVSKAKRCILLFRYKQPLVCMGLEEAMSWRSVVHRCKSCSSCFPICPYRDYVRCPSEALSLVVKVVQVIFPYKQVVWPSISPPDAATPLAPDHHNTSHRPHQRPAPDAAR